MISACFAAQWQGWCFVVQVPAETFSTGSSVAGGVKDFGGS